jgi:hypothetical protein
MMNHLSSSLESSISQGKPLWKPQQRQLAFNVFFKDVGTLAMALIRDQVRKVFKKGCAKLSFTLDLAKS